MVTVKLSKWGNSNAIRIPIDILDSLKVTKEDIEQGNIKFNLDVQGQKIIAQKIDNTPSIVQLFKNYNGDYEPKEIEWGQDLGLEQLY